MTSRRIVLLPCTLLISLALHAPMARAAPPLPLPGESAPSAVSEVRPPARRARPTVDLRVREGPYPDARVVVMLRAGEEVHVTGGPLLEDDTSWVYVTVDRGTVRYEGFCVSHYLRVDGGPLPEPTRATSSTPTAGSGGRYEARVTAYGGLRLRGGPGTAYAVEEIVPRHSTVTATARVVVADGYTWAEVLYRGRSLWGASDYLDPLQE